jgi:hypothetical protein
MHEACRVEQDVDLADPFGHRGDGRAVAYVELCDLRHAFLGERCETLLIDIGGKNRGALARKGDCRGASDARRAGGHERAFALEAV